MKIINICGEVMVNMCNAFGFYKALIMYFFIALATSFLLIRKNYKNVIISLCIQDEYYKIPSLYKKDPEKAQLEQTKYMLGSGYSVLSGFGIIILKLILSTFFMLACLSQAMDSYVLSLPVDVRVFSFKLFESNPIASIVILIMTVSCCFSSFYVYKMFNYGLIDNGLLGSIAVLISGLACLIMPMSGGVVYAFLTISEFIITVINLALLKDRNMETGRLRVKPYIVPEKDNKKSKTH